MADVTVLLQAVAQGEPGAEDRLYALLYAELARMARSQLRAVGPITLDPPALIHELWLRTRGAAVPGQRGAFFALASRVMHSVVVDHWRQRNADKRGGGAQPMTLNTLALREIAGDAAGVVPAGDGATALPLDVEQLDTALAALAEVDARAHRVVQMRFFGAMAHEDIAVALAVSVPTIKRDWRRARAFLYQQLKP